MDRFTTPEHEGVDDGTNASEILFEASLYQFSGNESVLSILNNRWQKRYVILQRYGQSAFLQIYRNQPKDNESPKQVIPLESPYRVDKRYNERGKPYVCTVTTNEDVVMIGCHEERLFHLLSFYLHTQMQLLDEVTEDVFVVRPDSSEAHRQLGARGNMCIMHVSPCGILLCLELSRCVLALWPLSCIKTFECSGQGQITIETGKNSPAGEAAYMFKTRIGQDIIIYNKLDCYVNHALEGLDSRSSMSAPAEFAQLLGYARVFSDERFTHQLRRISRDIYDPVMQHIGGGSSSVVGVSPDLINDTSLRRPPKALSRRSSKDSVTRDAKGVVYFDMANATVAVPIHANVREKSHLAPSMGDPIDATQSLPEWAPLQVSTSACQPERLRLSGPNNVSMFAASNTSFDQTDSAPVRTYPLHPKPSVCSEPAQSQQEVSRPGYQRAKLPAQRPNYLPLPEERRVRRRSRSCENLPDQRDLTINVISQGDHGFRKDVPPNQYQTEDVYNPYSYADLPGCLPHRTSSPRVTHFQTAEIPPFTLSSSNQPPPPPSAPSTYNDPPLPNIMPQVMLPRCPTPTKQMTDIRVGTNSRRFIKPKTDNMFYGASSSVV